MSKVKSDLYKSAGVDIDLAQKLLSRVKKNIAATKRPEVLAPIGGFGGLFQLDLSKYQNPVMVTSIDGVGTKLMIANMMEKFDTVGHDIVNHCIDDIAVQGAEPLYFLDYLGIGRLRSPLYETVLDGMAQACKAQGVTLIGGETAEMPGMYADDFDLVGCITGIVDKNKIITGENISQGDIAIGIQSSGLHTNGFSLARKALFNDGGYNVHSYLEELGEEIGIALLKPHTCYWPAVKSAFEKAIKINGIAHITGGGLYDNVPRILPNNVDVIFKQNRLPVPRIFDIIQKTGKVPKQEMFRVFNMGIGMVWFVDKNIADSALSIIKNTGFEASVIGEVVQGSSKVLIDGIDEIH